MYYSYEKYNIKIIIRYTKTEEGEENISNKNKSNTNRGRGAQGKAIKSQRHPPDPSSVYREVY